MDQPHPLTGEAPNSPVARLFGVVASAAATGTAATDLQTADAHQQAGRHSDAARTYHALLQCNPDHVAALHNFGVLHQKCSQPARAIELISRAIALRPDAAAYYANLAEAHRALGQHMRAIDCYRTALRLEPNNAEAANNLGLILHDLRRYQEAVDKFRAALKMRPDFAMAANNLGTTLCAHDKKDEALVAYREAVKLDPALALAHANLGQLLVDEGQLAGGLLHCHEAVRLQPDLAAARNNLGNAMSALERWPEAEAAYSAALRLDPQSACIHANIGRTLQRQGKFAEAPAAFRQATELSGDKAESWPALAEAYSGNENWTEAIRCCERVVTLKPEQAAGHLAMGWALHVVGRLTEAAACLRRALELEPQHIEALTNQGGLHEELGEMAEAEACYRLALAIAPQAPAPLACLAFLRPGPLPEADRDALRLRLKDRMAQGPRARLLFALAHVCDARDEHAEAAACLRQANGLALELRGANGRRYEPDEHTRFVDLLISGFTPEVFDRLASAGDDTRQPIFVFGMPRSGTTLVEHVLASHSRVHGAGELHLGRDCFGALPSVLGSGDKTPSSLKDLNVPGVRQLSQRYWDGLRALQQNEPLHRSSLAERFVDKMPDNYLYLGLLALLFPRATLIHVRRDLRDVALSCWMTDFRTIRWANDPEHLARRIHEYRRLMAFWRQALPAPVHEVVYERLVDDFEGEARRLVEACGLEWEPACLEFHRTVRPVHTASVMQVRQPLYRRAVARWKHYESELADLFGRLPAD